MHGTAGQGATGWTESANFGAIVEHDIYRPFVLRNAAWQNRAPQTYLEDRPSGYSKNPPDGHCIWGFFRLQWNRRPARFCAMP